MSGPPAIVFTDWDGTVTLQDSNDYLTENLGFGKPRRLEINDEILNERMSFQEGFTEMLKSIPTPFPECIDYLLKHIQLDPGFKDFYQWCFERKIPVIVISSGMKPIIHALLKNLVGDEAIKNIEIISNDVNVNDDGTWNIVYKDPESSFGHDKSKSIREYLQRNGYSNQNMPLLFYCGDGVSDLSAAKETNLLFAKHGKDLITYCNRENIPYTEFNSFEDILSKITKIVGEGLVNVMELSSIRTRISRRLSRGDTSLWNKLACKNQQSKKAQVWCTMKASLVKYSSFIGPGLMVSVAYMDPGNYATGITAGASNRYSLLFIVFLSNIIAIFLQSLCIKLGSVTGYDLARCCREYLPHKLNIVLWILAECAIIATDVAEVIGSAIALNILLKIPLPAGVAITIVDVLFVLMAYRNDTSSTKFVKLFEYAVALLVVAVVVCFAVELSQIPGDMDTVRAIFRGYLPSLEMFKGSGMTIATSIIGSTVMIHSLFLGSGIVQPRLREYDVRNGHVVLDKLIDAEDEVILNEKSESKQRRFIEDKEAEYFYNSYKPSYEAIEYSFKYSIIELVVTLFTFALFVNLAILIIAGATLYDTPEAMDADLYAIHNLLCTNLAPVVGTVFMLALLFSGQSAGIVCTIAGQIVSEGHINWTVKPWLRRLITRGIAIVPCMIISLCIGRNGLDKALNISQVVISILLPPLTAPLIYFTCKKSIMKIELPADRQLHEPSQDEVHQAQDAIDFAAPEQDIKYKYMNNNWLTTIIVVFIWLFVSVLNIYAIVDMARNGVAGS